MRSHTKHLHPGFEDKKTRTIAKAKSKSHSLPFLSKRLTAFTFKEKKIRHGRYRIPFAFTLPFGVPGSFHYAGVKEKVSITYALKV